MIDEKLTELRDICRCRSGHAELSDLSIAAAFLALDLVAWDGNKGFAWCGIDKAAWQQHVKQPGVKLLEVGLCGSHVERIPKLLRMLWTDPENGVVHSAGEVVPVPQVVFHVAGAYRESRREGTAVVTPWTEADYFGWHRRWARDGEFVVAPRQFESCVNRLRSYMRQQHGVEMRRQS